MITYQNVWIFWSLICIENMFCNMCRVRNKYYFYCNVVALGKPRNFLIFATGSRNLTFFWLPPVTTKSSGVVHSYTLSCQSLGVKEDSLLLHFSKAQSGLTINTFHPFTRYQCSVYAKNPIGRSPAVNEIVTTLQDGNVKSIYFNAHKHAL